MNIDTVRHVARIGLLALFTAFVLSLAWHIPYIYTVTGYATWTVVGHLITADDDAPGGFSNPDGARPFPWAELAIKGLVLLILVGLIISVPSIRLFGGEP